MAQQVLLDYQQTSPLCKLSPYILLQLCCVNSRHKITAHVWRALTDAQGGPEKWWKSGVMCSADS